MLSSMVSNILLCQFLIFVLFYAGVESSPCKPRAYGDHNIVCVCDESYCDELSLVPEVASNQAALYETNKSGARFQSSVLNFSKSADPGFPVLSVNRSDIYQFILGFGGAFTDATGINIKSVTPQLQKKIMSSYFSKTGLEYNMGRIPIASCDFSTKAYSYDDVPGDFNLTYFKLSKEDFTYKIPFIKEAMNLVKEDLVLFGTPWSAPGWMKTNNAMNGKGGIKGNPGGKYYKTWANYLVRFLEEYHANNITLWGLTLQNEPTDGCIVNFPFQAMCFPPDLQRDFLKLDFGSALTKAGFTPDNLRLMIGDDNRVILPKWADVILSDPDAAQYVSGIAFHWYLEDLFPHKLLDITQKKYPSLFFLPTEASTGSYPWEFPKSDLGNWNRGERYAHDIIQDLLNWSIGWIDWNLVLDMQGGPNWVSNFVDAPIIVNVGTNEFYKQPMYYALAHFSKCLPRGSYRIGLEVSSSLHSAFPFFLGSEFNVAAFQTPENKVVVIAVNRKNVSVRLAVYDNLKGYLNITVSPNSIQSYMW
ncbi:lysosomal acid glucosylceramidase-like [Argiope bruennichi]|uniref:lysosomal acid glucosylceramidase-like n=1 Tax=Argiope bruennichi TaxID=94029 RepID=UPI002493F0DF|nr:lysosomal acid glucosylceramidase-like [Argiope bruennichi]